MNSPLNAGQVRVLGRAEFAVMLCSWERPLPTCALSQPSYSGYLVGQGRLNCVLNSFCALELAVRLYAPWEVEMAYE